MSNNRGKPNKKRRGEVTTNFDRKRYQDEFGINQFQLSAAQRTMQNIIRSNTLSFVEGPAGTGKSLAILHYFVKEYLSNPIDIVVIKTPVESSGKDRIGFLPDDLDSKLEPHFAATKKTLSDLLNKGKVECDVGAQRIRFVCPNFILGSTLDNCLILIEEAQQLEPMIMKLLLERIGKNSKCVVTGDPHQLYTYDKNRNGLTDAVGRFFDKTAAGAMIAKYPDVGYFKFTPADVQRSDIVKTVIEAYQAPEGGDNAKQT